ncbi:MAG: hypothetical protein S4CHLAM37_14990 [Chlamydiia bacterium]|nr:hypothetical protein [Chlamydiia bacterium]
MYASSANVRPGFNYFFNARNSAEFAKEKSGYSTELKISKPSIFKRIKNAFSRLFEAAGLKNRVQTQPQNSEVDRTLAVAKEVIYSGL